MTEGGPVNRFRFLWKGAGKRAALQRAAAWLASPIYQNADCYIVFVHIEPDYRTPPENFVDRHGTHVVLAHTLRELERYENEMHPALSYRRLRDFLAEGGDRIIVLARRSIGREGTHRVIAYRKLERGIFSIWDKHVRIAVGPEYCMIHNNEVAPDYRGQHVSAFVRQTMYDYFRSVGIRTTLGRISPHNRASLVAHQRSAPGYTPVRGPVVRRRRWFGGWIDRMTPEDTIRSIIAGESRRFWSERSDAQPESSRGSPRPQRLNKE